MQRQFEIAPDPAVLEGLDRHFAFVPSTTKEPEFLTREQVEQFNQAGYIAPLAVFSADEIAAHRAYFDRLLDEALQAGRDSYSISTAHLTHGRIYDLLRDERLVQIARDLLGPDVIGWGSHYFCKMPGDGKMVAWHQDASYWPMSHTRTFTVWVAIDDADAENGCMQFVRGSHRFGRLDHRSQMGGGQEDANVLNQQLESPEKYGQIVDVPLAAGEVSIHSDLLVHGSLANHSQRRRCGLTLRYCTPDVRAAMDWHLKGVLVSGQDSMGNWACAARPAME